MLHDMDNNETNNLLVFSQNSTSHLAPILTYSQIKVTCNPILIISEINITIF